MNLDADILDFLESGKTIDTPKIDPIIIAPLTFEQEFEYILVTENSQKDCRTEVLSLKNRVLNTYIKDKVSIPVSIKKVYIDFPKSDTIESYTNNCESNIDKIINIIKTKGLSNKVIKVFEFHRICYLAKHGCKEYHQKYLPNLYNLLKTTLLHKKIQDIESDILIDEILMTFEKRQLCIGDRKTCNYKDFEKYLYRLAANVYHTTTICPIEFITFENEFYTNEIAMFSIYDILSWKLAGRYIYVKSVDNGQKDSWSYYYLHKKEGDKNYWKLDSRMDKLSISMEFVCNYASKLFISWYKLLHGDNIKRELIEGTGIGEDLKILYNNIEIIASRKGCSILLRKHLKKKLGKKLSKNDIIDRHEDDATVIDDYNAITKEDIDKEKSNELARLFIN